MRRRGYGRIGVFIAVCVLVLSVGLAELAPGAGASPARSARVTGFPLAKKPTGARGYAGLRPKAKKHAAAKNKANRKPRPAVKHAKKKKKKKPVATSGLDNPLMLLAFVAVGGLALFLIGSSLMSTPRARAKARDRKRVRKPATR